MVINKQNLIIAEHASSKPISGHNINSLQFTKTGTMVINRCYSIGVSALQVTDGELVGVIPLTSVTELTQKAGDGNLSVEVQKLPLLKGKPTVIKLPDNPVQFEITLSANFLLKLAQSVRDFTGPEEDAVVRIQFTGTADPVRIDARNSTTGQKWEALLMPRELDADRKRFAESTVPLPPPPPIEPVSVPIPPQNDLEMQLAEALKIAQGL